MTLRTYVRLFDITSQKCNIQHYTPLVSRYVNPIAVSFPTICYYPCPRHIIMGVYAWNDPAMSVCVEGIDVPNDGSNCHSSQEICGIAGPADFHTLQSPCVGLEFYKLSGSKVINEEKRASKYRIGK